ncbi:40S ribosomal protein S17 [Clonorchis sinensis]|uniref:Small ribosomal subunit protein eS17 n=1 Tax=Clonorchis sinensis TaxID=79923 RepID=A0A8T1MJQ4_CLOSI|nr:40S ribosomal protein S17 [Clonorchis sinensis]
MPKKPNKRKVAPTPQKTANLVVQKALLKGLQVAAVEIFAHAEKTSSSKGKRSAQTRLPQSEKNPANEKQPPKPPIEGADKYASEVPAEPSTQTRSTAIESTSLSGYTTLGPPPLEAGETVLKCLSTNSLSRFKNFAILNSQFTLNSQFSGVCIFLEQVKLGPASVEDVYRTIVQKVHEADAMLALKKLARNRMSRRLLQRIWRLLEKRSQLFFTKLTKGETEDELAFRKMRNRFKSEIRRWNMRKQAIILDRTRKKEKRAAQIHETLPQKEAIRGRVRTKTVKKASRFIIERFYGRLTRDFHTNKKVCQDIACINSKRLRNKIAGYVTHLMKRLETGNVRGISVKMQEEERERRDNYQPEISHFDTIGAELDPVTQEMLQSMNIPHAKNLRAIQPLVKA